MADARADDSRAPLLPHVLRQLAAVVSGAICAAEGRAISERIGVLDVATGLHDRRSAETYLRRELARARRYCEPLSLVSIDLDRFPASSYNDQTWGYPERRSGFSRRIARLLIRLFPFDR